MALRILGSASIGTGIRVNLGETDSLFVSAAATIGRTDEAGSEAAAVYGSGSNHRVDLFGSIASTGSAVELGDSLADDSGNRLFIGKSGVVRSYLTDSTAVVVRGYGSSVENDGLIIGKSYGLGIGGGGVTTQSVVDNAGTISAEWVAISHNPLMVAEKLVVNNSGLIKGGTAFFTQPTSIAIDIVNNSGRMIGFVDLGGGADTYDGRDGRVDGDVRGGDGNDTLLGGARAETLDGQADNDVISGFGGDDTLLGGAGDDTVSGGTGNDRIDGGAGIDSLSGDAGNDTIFGGNDADTLSGGIGNDRLSGNAGNDRLTGGAGADRLSGGAGADTFIFRSTADSGVSASGRDTIADFNRGQGDKVDLQAIDANTKAPGNHDFTFIGTQTFHKVAGELRYEIKAGDTLVHGDVDGDGKADFSVLFDASITFKAGDFLL